MDMPRMRTAEGVYAEIKRADPNSGVCMHRIRQIIKEQRIPVTPAGRNKKLVNLDTMLRYLSDGEGWQAHENRP